MTHLFVDESYRRNKKLLVAAVVPPADLNATRAVLRQQCRPGQRRIHFVKESDRRRKAIISALLGTTARVWVVQADGPPELARAISMAGLIARLPEVRAHHLVLESRGQRRDVGDRQVIYDVLRKDGYQLTYRHLEPRLEPLLWIPDAIGWAYGAGGDWARRVQPMIDRVVTLP